MRDLNSEERGTDPFPLRLPNGMRDRLRASAAADRRSVNSQIIVLLERALPAEDPKAGAERAEAKS